MLECISDIFLVPFLLLVFLGGGGEGGERNIGWRGKEVDTGWRGKEGRIEREAYEEPNTRPPSPDGRNSA